MALHVITGKPGSGKTYHAMTQLLREVGDWCEHEKRTGEPFARKCYTNLPINEAGIDDYVGAKTGDELRPCRYVEKLDLSGRWWDYVPDGALVIVDEVHEHFGSEKDYEADLSAFRDYVATHRHRGHDLWMISQHIENISIEILRIAESVADVQNLKAGRIPVLGIPIADIDVVRRAFGSVSQVYCVSIGRVVGRAIKWGEATETHVITSKVFGTYDSHNRNDGSSGASHGDRPTVKLGRLEALWWFAKRHSLRAVLQLFAALMFVGCLIGGVFLLPALFSGLVKAPASAESKPVPSPAVASSVDDTTAAPSKPDASEKLTALQEKFDAQTEALAASEKHAAELAAEVERLRVEREVAAIFDEGVLLRDGTRVQVGEWSEGPDKKRLLEKVEPKIGRALWNDGKETWLR